MGRWEGPVRWIQRSGRRVGVSLLGGVLLLAGAAMLLLPGPGLVTVAAGFAVLATEYAWAKRAWRRTSRQARDTSGRLGRFARRHLPG